MRDLRSSPVPGLHEGDHVRGAPEDPLVIFYGDFSCPHCATAYARLDGKPLRILYRHFALKSRPRAIALACVAEAASRQGAFWGMHDAIFADPARADDPHLWTHAERLGLDLQRLQRDRRDPEVCARVAADLREGMRGGVAGTPTLFVDGVSHSGPPTVELLDALGTGPVR